MLQSLAFQVAFGVVLGLQQLYNPVQSKERALDHCNRGGGFHKNDAITFDRMEDF